MNHTDELKRLSLGLLSPTWNTLACKVLDNSRFRNAPGGVTRHHAYRGGLAEHTLDVATRLLDLVPSSLYPHGMDQERALMAAIWHDYGKILEYRLVDDMSQATGERVEATPFHDRTRHVVWSWREFMNASDPLVSRGMLLESQEEIGHAILAHHGRREWGSPVEPQTKLAHLLHAADMMSFQANVGIGG